MVEFGFKAMLLTLGIAFLAIITGIKPIVMMLWNGLASILKAPPEDARSGGDSGGEEDELFDDAARLVVAERQASASFLQRRMRIGFSRAARLIDMMERDGLLGPPQGSKPREVLVKPDFYEEWEEARRSTEA